MKWLRTLVLINKGGAIDSGAWLSVHNSYVRSIQSIDHPAGTGRLKLRRKVRLLNNQWRRNGVSYLKSRFLEHIVGVEKWQPEGLVDLASDRVQPKIKLYPSKEDYQEPITSEFGGFDLVTTQ